MTAGQLAGLRQDLPRGAPHGGDRHRHFPAPVQEARELGADLDAAVSHAAQLARQHGGLAQAGCLELEKQMIGPGKHMAGWLLAPAPSAIPQLGIGELRRKA